MVISKDRPTTAILVVVASILYFVLTSLGIVKELFFAQVMFTVQSVGGKFWNQSFSGMNTKKIRQYFRGDAAFAKPEIYEYLEENGFLYAIRLPSNDILQRQIHHLLTRPVGRPPRKPIVLYEDFKYRAASWDRPRRVVAKVEWHQGELFPRVGFIVNNMSARAKGVVRFYNGRGTAEQWIK